MAAMFSASVQTVGGAAGDGTQQIFVLSPRSTSSSLMTTRPAVLGTSVSGTSILDIRMVPGAVMMTALSRCLGSIPKAI